MAQREISMMDVEDYLLLDESSKSVGYEFLDGEVRNAETWMLSSYSAGSIVHLESLDIAFEVDEVYSETSLAEEE
jgi:hypothetical protein